MDHISFKLANPIVKIISDGSAIGMESNQQNIILGSLQVVECYSAF